MNHVWIVWAGGVLIDVCASRVDADIAAEILGVNASDAEYESIAITRHALVGDPGSEYAADDV